MPRILSLVTRFAATLWVAGIVHAQQEVIWSSIILTTFGDRVPLLSPDLSVLTPLGAQQMYNAGSYFRSRYITDPMGKTTIPSIAYDEMDMSQTFPYTLADVFVQQSAQAFMNGLYPPVTSTNGTDNSPALLANGTLVTAPLGGQQYFGMQTYQPSDPNYLYMSANTNCMGYDEEVMSSYTSTPSFQNTKKANQARYNTINSSAFSNAIPHRDVGYGSSYQVWDYLNYMRLHNATINRNTSSDDLTFTRNLANNFALQTVGMSNNTVLSLPGRGISSLINSILLSNLANNGTESNLNLLFTSWEPLLSLITLLGIQDTDSNLHAIPNVGSSIAFELFSESSSSSGSLGGFNATYPDNIDDLYVRFSFRNGTVDGSNSSLGSYTMGAVSSAPAVPYAQFLRALSSWQLGSVAEWCSTCGGDNVGFCVGYESAGNAGGGGGGVSSMIGSGASSNGLSPAVGGVIGAIVTLVVTGLAALALMLLGGFRLRRDRPSVVRGKPAIIGHKRRQSSMGGFKGAEKMASDVDLPKGVEAGRTGAMPVHNRTSSWEMKEGGQRRQERDSQRTAVGEPGPEISETAGISIIKGDDEELDGMKPVNVRESV